MGRPKALLDVGDEAFLERAVRVLKAGGCAEVIVVCNDDDSVLAEMISSAGARATRGAGAGTEQIESLRAGLRALDRQSVAAVVLPVDHPRVQPETVSALIETFRPGGARIVVPSYRGKRGHPVLFGSVLFAELLSSRLPQGARSVVHAHADETEEVEVDDPGVVVDVDTPGEYEELMGESG
jgi:molybdenum cofactor cytidylyltransferase